MNDDRLGRAGDPSGRPDLTFNPLAITGLAAGLWLARRDGKVWNGPQL